MLLLYLPTIVHIYWCWCQVQGRRAGTEVLWGTAIKLQIKLDGPSDRIEMMEIHVRGTEDPFGVMGLAQVAYESQGIYPICINLPMADKGNSSENSPEK